MDLGLSGKQALVTGASAGIGFSIASQLAQEGCSVWIASRSADHVQRAVRALQDNFPKIVIEGMTVDLSSAESTKAFASSIVARGGVDILVNNTGGPATGKPLDISLENWDRGYTSLLRSGVELSQRLIPLMEKKKWGRILTITSTSAKQIIHGLPVSSTFRAALTAWTKELAKQVGRSGILVNNLLPGPTRTERLQELESKSPQFFQSMSQESALGRIAEPDEIARVATFLCSAANTYLTGTDVLVDGGYTTAL